MRSVTQRVTFYFFGLLNPRLKGGKKGGETEGTAPGALSRRRGAEAPTIYAKQIY